MYICKKLTGLEYTERIMETNDWATYLLVLCFLLLAVAKYFYPRRFGDFMTLALNNKFFSVHGKEDKIQHPFNIIFFGFQVICVTVFIHLLIKTLYGTTQDEPWGFVQIGTIYTVFVLGKVSIEKIVGNIFSIDSIIDHYLYQKLGYRNFIALLLFAGSLIFLYILPGHKNPMIIFALCILGLNAISLFYTYKKSTVLIVPNFFYFILYLCALEISPYIIVYKLFITKTII